MMQHLCESPHALIRVPLLKHWGREKETFTDFFN